MSIHLEVDALDHQYDFVMSTARFPALVSGLGAGKTEALVYRTLTLLTAIPNARIGLYEPTVDLIKRILFPRFEEIFENATIPYKLNKSESTMQVWLPSGKAEIIFRSMENPFRIIGYETHHSILDEIDTLTQDKASDVWYRVIARNRKSYYNPDGSRGTNTVGITTTPEGFKFVYNMWVKEHADNPDYQLIRGRTEANHHLHPDYVPTLRATYPPQLIDAYLNGLFVNLKGNTVYAQFDREASHTDLTIKDFPEGNMIHIGLDFNISRGAAVIIMKGEDGLLYVVDEIHHTMDTPATIVAIQSKFPDRVVTVYPDASGSSRKSMDSSKSDHRLLRDAGFRIKSRRKNPPVRERVINVQTALLNANNERNLLINTRKCPELTEALEKQVFDENSAPVKDNTGTDDILDALGYAIMNMKSLAGGRASIARMRFA